MKLFENKERKEQFKYPIIGLAIIVGAVILVSSWYEVGLELGVYDQAKKELLNKSIQEFCLKYNFESGELLFFEDYEEHEGMHEFVNFVCFGNDTKQFKMPYGNMVNIKEAMRIAKEKSAKIRIEKGE